MSSNVNASAAADIQKQCHHRDGPADPRNWSTWRRRFQLIALSLCTLQAPMASSMVAPAFEPISKDLHITSKLETQLILSIFVISYGLGPLIYGPLSEVYGRTPIIHGGNLLYVVFNTACGGSQTAAQLLVFRFLAGFAGSATLAVGMGVIRDCYAPEDRGSATALYNLAPLLGPSLGPLIGGLTTEHLSWRWVFYMTSVLAGAATACCFCISRETYMPIILAKQGKRRALARLDTPQGDRTAVLIHHVIKALQKLKYTTTDGTGARTMLSLLRQALSRPIKMIVHEPITQILTLYTAYLYGTMYLMLSTFANLWTSRYHQSHQQSGLNYVAIGTGYFIGSQVCNYSVDRIYKHLKAKNGGRDKPEYKLPLMIPAAFFTSAGLFVYGWSAQADLPWAVPDLGAALFAMGTMMVYQCISGYNVDCFGPFSASASSAILVLRGFAGFGLPLAGPIMYEKLGYGWANSLLGFVAISIGLPAFATFWLLGERLRSRSRFI